MFFAYVRNIFFSIHYHADTRPFFYRLDCVVNAILGGDPRETISSRIGKAVRGGRDHINDLVAYPICALLHIVDDRHCSNSIHDEYGDRAVGFAVFFILLVIGGFIYAGISYWK